MHVHAHTLAQTHTYILVCQIREHPHPSLILCIERSSIFWAHERDKRVREREEHTARANKGTVQQRTKANDLKELPSLSLSHTHTPQCCTDQIEFKCIKALLILIEHL